MSKISTSFICLLLITGLAVAALGQPAATETGGEEELLNSLSWLVGYWVGETDGVRSEVLWLPAAGGVMLGLHRDIQPSGEVVFEYLRIEDRPDGFYYIVSPQGKPPTVFPMEGSTELAAYFVNNENEWPQRLVYFLTYDKVLHSRAEGQQDGLQKARDWIWEPAKLP